MKWSMGRSSIIFDDVWNVGSEEYRVINVELVDAKAKGNTEEVSGDKFEIDGVHRYTYSYTLHLCGICPFIKVANAASVIIRCK